MAYLHCHTKDCGWSQDDFYSFSFRLKDIKDFITLNWQKRPFGYNPFSKVLEDIGDYIKPRMIEWDWGFIHYNLPELIEYTGVNVKIREKKVKILSQPRLKHLSNQDDYITIYSIFSWKWLLLEIVKDIKNAKNTKWWTYKSFKKDRDKGIAKCPKCGKVCFDID